MRRSSQDNSWRNQMYKPTKLSLVAAIAFTLGAGAHASEGSSSITLPIVPVSQLASGSVTVYEAEEVDLVEKTEQEEAYVEPSDKSQEKVATEEAGAKVVAIPTVSPEVLTKNVPSAKPLAEGQKVSTITAIGEEKAEPSYRIERRKVLVQPGTNELLNISLGHPNRIVTPFQSPKVLKLDKHAVATVKDNVIYFATDRANVPVTIYVREDGSEDLAVSLTLIPQKIPPREIFLEFPENTFLLGGGFKSEKAKAWERSQPYEQTLTNLLRSVALGEVPQGYAMRNLGPNEATPVCQQRGLSFDFSQAQVLDGHDFKAFVGVVTNIATQPVEFVESNRAARKVDAVSAWPNVHLE